MSKCIFGSLYTKQILFFDMFKLVNIFFRLRYIVPATAVGGYYTAKQKYDDFKSRLPELPNFEIGSYFKDWSILQDAAKTDIPVQSLTQAFKEKLEAAGVTGSKEKVEQLEGEIRRKAEETKKRNEEVVSLRKELERLRKEYREFRSAVRNSGGSASSVPHNVKRKFKKSLIEIYSEVLDELSGYDSSYKMVDHLPKVVVVGDQSSGKTSVLEMIAGARIFPRGAGEMMTRAPVQVTLSEGPYHIARFKDSSREYDLTKESELAELRREIEDRMRASVQGGKTVSNQVISLTIQGPGIQRMVLVDLPGIIGTVTTELAPDTKECIKNMVTEYMGNPNAIILCIQDGSLDAERSIFTDLVHEVDKKGRRTILVLTKVDVAEKTHTNPSKIKKILDGELFPMKALGYYAVVAGKSGKNEDIQEIRDYEEQFFLTSSLREKGILNPNQCTTRNLSAKVSECFWGMVKASIEQQSDAFKATLYNLEAEWNHLFPHKRQLTRDELFFNARNEILDGVAKLSRLSTKLWDQFISTQLWLRVNDHIMKRIYFPASKDPLHFSAKVDIELQRWVESLELPKLAINVAQDSLRHQFDNLLDFNLNSKNNTKRHNCEATDKDDTHVYQDLKRAVIHEALKRHQWKTQALDVLKVVQLEALSKQITLTRDNWDKSIDLLQDCLGSLMNDANQDLVSLLGLSFSQRWLKWKSITPDQRVNQMIHLELEKVLTTKELDTSVSPITHAKLSEPELKGIKRSLESQGIETSEEAIQRLWVPYHKHHFLAKEVNRSQECRKMFYFYENDLESGTDCSHVLFFWRIKRMLEFTANSLRRQILEDECRRIEREIVDILEEYSEDSAKKIELISGKRVELAEELRRVRQIQEKLDEFITALNQEAN